MTDNEFAMLLEMRMQEAINSPAMARLKKAVTDSVLNEDSAGGLADLLKPETDRKEYLKLKARERRARQKAEKAGK